MTKSTIWISYDLGIKGDYEGLYAWLDSHKAKECGDSLAVLAYDYSNNMVESLKAELNKNVSLNKRSRIYLIHRDRASNRIKGTFVVGGRRMPPWTGYGQKEPGASDDEA